MASLCNLQHFYGLGSQSYHFEAERLVSFTSWSPEHPVSPSALSKNCWYSPKDSGSDETRTFCCNASHRNWGIGDSPIEKHKEISPQCPIARGETLWERNGSLVYNIPIPETNQHTAKLSRAVYAYQGMDNSAGMVSVQETDQQADVDVHDQHSALTAVAMQFGVTLRLDRGKVSKPQPLMPSTADGSIIYTACCEPPGGCFPCFASLDKRNQTFRKFPREIILDTRDIARQGFFYADYKDYIICYKCGLGLYKLTSGDDPGLDHARLQPFCSHFRSVTGTATIAEAQRDMTVTGC